MTITRRTAIALSAAALASMYAGVANAQAASYPSRPISLWAPTTAGGQGDILARLLAQRLGEALRQQVIVENCVGANTMLATRAAVNAAPDGYTLLLGFTVIVQNPLLYGSKAGYDPFKDLVPVSNIGANYVVLATGANSGFRDLRDFIAQAKVASKPLTYATVGVGSTAHLYMEMLAKQANINLIHVPYKGEAQFLPDLTAGRVHAGVISPMSARQFSDDGKLQLLAVTGRKRIAVLPDVPTFLEQGINQIDASGWVGIFAPARTPNLIVEQLSTEFMRIVADPQVRQKIASLGMDPTAAEGSTDFARTMKRSHDDWTRIIQTTGISLQE